MLRLPKDDRGSLARDMTLRRPVEGDGDGRKMGKRGRRWGRGPAEAQASPGSGGEGETDADAAKVAPCWCTTVMAVTCRSWIGCWRS